MVDYTRSASTVWLITSTTALLRGVMMALKSIGGGLFIMSVNGQVNVSYGSAL